MNKLILVIFLFCVLISSCNKDTNASTGYGSVELLFKLRYGTQPLVYTANYDYFGQGQISFSTTEFFYSEMKLLNSSDTILLKDADYFNTIRDTSATAAEAGRSILIDSIPIGTYSNLIMNIGLTATQNLTKPADYPSTSPLGDDSRYWPGWHSYIFTKTEGTFQNGNIYNFGYHSGFDNAMRSAEFTKDIKVEDGHKTTIEIQIDYKKLFDAGGGNGIDIPAKPNAQDTSVFMMSFQDRFQSAVNIASVTVK